MSGSSQPSEAGGPDLAAGGGAVPGGDADDPGRPDGRKPGVLRRRLLGRRQPEKGGRPGGEGSAGALAANRADPEIAEMRRDIAALWLAFNHHERTLRDLAGRLEASLGALAPPRDPDPGALEEIPGAETRADPGQVATPISEQLSDLDDVLDAIERATEVLERTHADEIERPGPADDRETSAEPEADEPEDDGAGTAA